MAALGPDRACVVEYEEMHADMPGALARLARTLGPAAQDRLKQPGAMADFCRALGFDVMKSNAAHATFLRKGQPGNWREHFRGDEEARMAEALEARLPRATSVCGRTSWRPAPAGST